MRKDILVTYDVNTEDAAGRKRLRKVAKACEGRGQRVQFSVFECTVNEADMEQFREKLVETINPESDSLRIYHLQGDRDKSVETYGRDTYVDFDEEALIA